jgi:hypothetical protein
MLCVPPGTEAKESKPLHVGTPFHAVQLNSMFVVEREWNSVAVV